MGYKVNVIEGVGAGFADKLASTGINTTNHLLEATNVDSVKEL
ncbi:MAG: hypothetical protein WBN29_19140 [Polyangiales bacterium]|jgi:hypothetical protein